MRWRRIILAVVAAMAATGSVRADMVPVSGAGFGCGTPSAVCDVPRPPSQPARHELYGIGFDAFDFPPVRLDVRPQADWPQSAEQPVLVLSDRQNSFNLCLYALVGLGLCKSAPWVKKIRFGMIPAWYCDAGPFQVGHSHVIPPDCLISAPACCFVPPRCGPEPPLPRYRREAIVSLWRKSQFTPTILASRGPPPACR